MPLDRLRRLALFLIGLALPLAGQAQSVILEQWPLTADNVATTAAAGVTASTPTFAGLALSDGSSTSGSIPGYSTARGQAFSPNGNNGGGWTSGTLSRTIYEEFTIVAASGYNLRVDSLIFSSAFNNSANGRVGVSYSTNGFTTLSEVTGGTLPAGGSASSPTAQPATATGAFTTVATDATLVPNRTSGPVVNATTYRLALNGATGVAVPAGQTLSIRLYYALGSTTAIRQAQLRAVTAKGVSAAVVATPCAAASNLTAGSIAATSAQLTFTAPGTNTSYTISTTPASSTQTVAAGPVTLGGLTPNTTYTVSVTSNCAGGAGTTATTTLTTAAAAALSSSVLQRWLLTADNNDEAATRSPNVTASAPTFANMAAADGTTVTGYTANSVAYGQATAPNADGTGWNGTIRPAYYEEFTTTATNGQLRLDSLILSSAFYNTANGKLAIAYSTDGFATSTYILGSAAAPVAVNNQNTSFSQFRLPLTAGAGVSLTNGQSIAFRLYFALGTTSSRYALLKTVAVKGEATPTCANPANLAVGSITSNSASVSFTPAAGSTTYVLTYQPAGGAVTTVTPAPTASPVALSGLASATTYTVTLQSTCAAGQSGVLSTTFTTRLLSAALQQWPLQADMQDQAATRSAAVAASTASLRRLQLADGSVSSVPAYSGANGQGLGPTAAGTWNTTSSPATPDNVQTVNRKYYEQFVVTAASGYTIRLDSLILSAAGYGSANGRLAVVYSRSNFISDSTDVAAGGKAVPGGPLPAANYGAFNNVINLPNQTSGLSTTYRLPLAATSAGIALTPGQRLTVRVYFGIGSSSAGRYALLRDVQLLGQVTASPLPVTLTRFEAVRQGNQALLSWATASEHNSKGFSIEASADGYEFRAVGFVPSVSATSTTAQAYRFVDAPELAAGTRYYRLKQLDLDGTSTYTPARAVAFGSAVVAAVAGPNPFKEVLYLRTQAAQAVRTTVVFTDASGRPVLRQELEVPAGAAQLTVHGLGQLPRGFYVLHFALEGKTQRVKLVKE